MTDHAAEPWPDTPLSGHPSLAAPGTTTAPSGSAAPPAPDTRPQIILETPTVITPPAVLPPPTVLTPPSVRATAPAPPPPPPVVQPPPPPPPPPPAVQAPPPPPPSSQAAASTAALLARPTSMAPMSPPGRPAPDLVEPVIGSPVGTTPVLLAPVVLPQHAPDTPPAPPPRTPGVAWGTPVAAQAPAKRSKPNHLLHWNWAAGSVVGLAVLILVFAVPRFAVATDLHQVSDQQTGDWLLYGAGLGSILTIICLASRRIAVVALLALATSVAAIVAIVQLQGTWTLSDHNTWASLGLVVGLAILGITSSIGLRRAG